MYGTSARSKDHGRCGEMAVVGSWPSVEVRLYLNVDARVSVDGSFDCWYIAFLSLCLSSLLLNAVANLIKMTL